MPRPAGWSRLALVLLCACGTTNDSADRRIVIDSEGWRLFGDLALPAAATARPVPAVLLLNGAGRDRSAYTVLARRLAERGVASLRLDLRSMGESTNRGVFVPFDSTGHNDSLGFRRAWVDVQAAFTWLAARPEIDAARLGAVGASFSGEVLADAIREPGGPVAVAALSPGSFSDSSLSRVDGDGRRWLFVYAGPEMIVRRWQMDRWTRRGSGTARVELVRDSLHATDLLGGSPLLVERLAEWLTRALGVEPADDRWARAADRVAAGIAPGWDDLRRPGEATSSLGDGVAGRLRFLAAWHLARRSPGSREAVRQAADQLVSLTAGADSTDASLYRGRAGVALALYAAADALGDSGLERRADAEVRRLIAAGQRDGGGIRWSAANDVLSGDAGITAALRAVWRRGDDSTVRAVALDAGRSLAARGRADSGGRVWPWRDNASWNLPNFSHGTAGIGTVLAMLSRELDASADLLGAARGAARYLETIAVRDERGMRIPYGWPVPDGGWSRPFDANWAHGQAGTARLFWELWRATGDTLYLGTVTALVTGIDSAGVLGTPAPDYGSEPFVLDYRFGLTGIADLYADLYDATGDRRYLAGALQLAERILSRADSGAALTWTAPRRAFMAEPGVPAAFTGLLHGASGSGLLFLKLDALLHGGRPPDPLPDSPFGGW